MSVATGTMGAGVGMQRLALTRGSVIRIHLSDDSSVEGIYHRSKRGFHVLLVAKIEANGTWIVSKSEALLVPRRLVKLIEVVAC